jgi:tetratricopeptide (TPR) repeat protein
VHGYDLGKKEIKLHFGREADRWFSMSEFERVWRAGGYWSVEILPPMIIPDGVGEPQALESVMALERSQRWREARAAYMNILLKWPTSSVAWFGLGNVSAAIGLYGESEKAYLSALAIAPHAAPIWNNLSEIYLRQGLKSQWAKAKHQDSSLITFNPLKEIRL